jgi:hypothetical protein
LHLFVVELELIDAFPEQKPEPRQRRDVKKNEEVLHPLRQTEHHFLRFGLQVDDNRQFLGERLHLLSAFCASISRMMAMSGSGYGFRSLSKVS